MSKQRPAAFDITCYQGATFGYEFTWLVDDVPVDLGGYTAAMQVRPTHDSDDVLVDLTDGAGLTLGGAAGTIDLAIDADSTAAIPAGSHVYDLELTDPFGIVTRLLDGAFAVDPEVTR